jgi:ribose transport system substrate-binding protein
VRNHASTARKALIFAALLPVAALSACGGGSNASSKADDGTLQVAFFNATATNTFTHATLQGMQDTAKSVNAQVTEFDAKYDGTVQVNQMQDALATGKFDVFVVMPVNNAGLVPVATSAVADGVTVVSVLSTIGSDIDTLKSAVDGVITIGQTFGDNGTDIANESIAACGDLDPCKVAYMPGDAKQASEKVRADAVLAGLAAAPSVEVVSTQPGGFDAGTGLKTTQDILTAHPDVNVIAASAGQAIGGALQALQEAGLDGKVKLVSNGATVEDVNGIRDGSIFASPVFLPYTDGVLAMQLSAKAQAGKTVPTEVDELKYSPIGRVADAATLATAKGKAFKGEYHSH